MSFGPFAVGLSKGYTSPALASMQQPPPLPVDNATAADAVSASMTSLSITEQQGSWIASLSLLGALFGGLCAGVVIRYGRRRTLWLVTAPFSASWFLTMFATCVEMIYVTAFLVGFFSAIIQLATQVGIIIIFHGARLLRKLKNEYRKFHMTVISSRDSSVGRALD